jgi:hypothetical protein
MKCSDAAIAEAAPGSRHSPTRSTQRPQSYSMGIGGPSPPAAGSVMRLAAG